MKSPHHVQIVIHGDGRNFCAGIDLDSLGVQFQDLASAACEGRARLAFASFVKVLQDAMTAFERCRWPIVAAVHGACVGAGIDLITACDIRLATEDARFCVKEVDLGITADMGTLARLPGIVGDGMARDLALTARTISGTDAKSIHLVSRTFLSLEALLQGAEGLARSLATKSPLALVGTKKMLLYQRDHSVREGLDAVAVWNAAMLPGSKDLQDVLVARATGKAPQFSKL